MSPDEFIAELWSYAQEVPMAQHPWFQGILQHRWTRGQLILGEVQHYLRVRTNPIFFGYIAVNAVAEKQYELMEVVLENFTEELAGPRSHVDIMLQFLEEGGISREEADCAEPGAAETYQLHAEQDVGHGTRQIELIRRYATDQDTQEKVRRAVKLGVTAFTLEWDGHVQAMTSQREFWSGVAPLRLRQPQVRLPEARRP